VTIGLIGCIFKKNKKKKVQLYNTVNNKNKKKVMYQVGMSSRSSWFYVVGFILGFFFASSQTTILTFPMLYICNNTKEELLPIWYATYKTFSLLVYSIASTLNIYVINSEQILKPIWFVCTSYLGIITMTSFLFIISLIIFISFTNRDVKNDKNILFEKNFQSNNDDNNIIHFKKVFIIIKKN
jgi:hypothetical protein